MSRSNPGKLKPQRPKITVFAFGEGATEEAFLKYLKSLYAPRGCGVFVKVDSTSGGGPATIVEEAGKGMLWGYFDKGLVLLDTDKAWPSTLGNTALQYNLILIGSRPCIEGLFLSILLPSFDPTVFDSNRCKERFNGEYLTYDKALDCNNYGSIFSQELLDEKRNEVPELDAIIIRLTEDN